MCRLRQLRLCRGSCQWRPCVHGMASLHPYKEAGSAFLDTQLTVVTTQNCGLVAESHLIDEGSEWRSFGDKVRPKSYLLPASLGMRFLLSRASHHLDLSAGERGSWGSEQSWRAHKPSAVIRRPWYRDWGCHKRDRQRHDDQKPSEDCSQGFRSRPGPEESLRTHQQAFWCPGSPKRRQQSSMRAVQEGSRAS